MRKLIRRKRQVVNIFDFVPLQSSSAAKIDDFDESQICFIVKNGVKFVVCGLPHLLGAYLTGVSEVNATFVNIDEFTYALVKKQEGLDSIEDVRCR